MPDGGNAQQRGAAAVVENFLVPLVILGSLQLAITKFDLSWLSSMLQETDEVQHAASSSGCSWAGHWYSRDFYGGHGLQTQEFQVVCEAGEPCLIQVTKTTGDAHVPSGKVTWRTRALPEVGAEEGVRGYVHLRGDSSDPSDFHWGAMTVSALDCDHVRISGRWNGNFYRVDGAEPLKPESVPAFRAGQVLMRKSSRLRAVVMNAHNYFNHHVDPHIERPKQEPGEHTANQPYYVMIGERGTIEYVPEDDMEAWVPSEYGSALPGPPINRAEVWRHFAKWDPVKQVYELR